MTIQLQIGHTYLTKNNCVVRVEEFDPYPIMGDIYDYKCTYIPDKGYPVWYTGDGKYWCGQDSTLDIVEEIIQEHIRQEVEL